MDTKILPVVLLSNIVLLPNNDIRLEFEKSLDQTLFKEANDSHNNRVLVISQINKDNAFQRPLPKVGIVGIVTHKTVLDAENKVRVIISGSRRVSIKDYVNLDNNNEVLKAIFTDVDEFIEYDEEKLYTRKLLKEFEDYLRTSTYRGDNIINHLLGISSLSKLTDVIVPQLGLDIERLQEYLTEKSSIKRAEMLLSDFYKEKEIASLEKMIDEKVKKELDNSQKEYLLREKLKVIKQELGDITLKDDEVVKLKEQLEKLSAPEKIKERIGREIKKYESLPSMSPEVTIVRNYIDWMLELPWDIHNEDNDDLESVRKNLDSTHYGLDKVKERVIEYLAVKQKTKGLKSPILCLVGAPGVGKTSLAFGIAEAINKKFVKISVGGVNDEAEIVGHRRTYVGANPGRIIQAMTKAKCSNPVFLIDEIDKMSKGFKGDPASALLEILDPEQNKYFSDNYIEEEFDLSNVMFIATANYLYDIPEALQDRLEIVQLSGYTEYEKLDIAKRHLLPKICETHGVLKSNISMSDSVIREIIRRYTKEAGVRELERQISNVIRKVVTKIVLGEIEDKRVSVTKKDLPEYIGKPKYDDVNKKETSVGVVNGLAYTYYGGDTLPIEVNYYKGSGNLVLTGSLGEVMKESAKIALSYIKSNHKYFKIEYSKIVNNDIHVHVPEGAIKKDGPSAGIALTTALVSALSNLKIDKSIAMTGEITLRGDVLKIGGVKEKSIGAHRNGVKTIFIPTDNVNDLDEVPKEVKKDIEYIGVKDYKELFRYLTK